MTTLKKLEITPESQGPNTGGSTLDDTDLDSAAVDAPLTALEAEILKLVSKGLANTKVDVDGANNNAEGLAEEETETEPEAKEVGSNPWGLTDDEIEIFRRLPLGETDAEIATELRLVVDDVKDHMKSIFDKVEKKGRSSVATLAYESYRDEMSVLIDIDLTKLGLLTATDRKVLCLLSRNLSNIEMAEQLGVLGGISNYKTSVCRKLGIGWVQAGIYVIEAQEAGLLDVAEELKNPRVGRRRSGWQAATTAERSASSPGDPFLAMGVLEERTRPLFTWEYELGKEAGRALTLLGTAGFLENPDKSIPIKDGPILRLMVECGLVSESEAEQGELNLPQAVKAMLLGTRDAKRLMLAAETRGRALKNIDDLVERFVRAASKPKK